MRAFLTLCTLFLGGNLVLAQDMGPIKLSLTANPAPVPALRFALLPELRGQTPGNAAVHYRKVADLLGKVPADREERGRVFRQLDSWEPMPVARLPRAEVRKVLAMYQDVLQLLAKGTASEYCDWELAQRLRESGISTRLEEIQHGFPGRTWKSPGTRSPVR